MPAALQGLFSLAGRILLATIFLASGLHHGNDLVTNFAKTTHGLRNVLPMPEVLLPGAVAFLLIGGVLLVLGYQARLGALLLFAFLGLATYFFHNFWTMEGKAAQEQMIHAMKNLAMMGAMLFVIANGAGAWSVDGRLKKPAQVR